MGDKKSVRYSIAVWRDAARARYAIPLRVRSLSRSNSVCEKDAMIAGKALLVECCEFAKTMTGRECGGEAERLRAGVLIN